MKERISIAGEMEQGHHGGIEDSGDVVIG